MVLLRLYVWADGYFFLLFFSFFLARFQLFLSLSLSPRPSRRVKSSNDRASLAAERGVRLKPLIVLFRLSQLQTSGGAKKSRGFRRCMYLGLQDEEEERAAQERRSVRRSWKDRGRAVAAEGCPRIE